MLESHQRHNMGRNSQRYWTLIELWGTCLPKSFNDIGEKKLHSKVLERLTKDQLEAFDTSTVRRPNSLLQLDLSALQPREHWWFELEVLHECTPNPLLLALLISEKGFFRLLHPKAFFSELKLEDLAKRFNRRKSPASWSSLQPSHVHSHLGIG